MLNDPPSTNEFEVSIFGPGKGECIVLHLGGGHWAVIDSCVDQQSRRPVALAYLENLGVNVAENVRLIVATHAHDDHFAGIGSVVEACTSAVFVCSAAATAEEFLALVELDQEAIGSLRLSAYREYSRIFEHIASRPRDGRGIKAMRYGLESRVVFEAGSAGALTRIRCLSPTDEAVTRSRKAFASAFPVAGQRRRAPSVNPNELSVALWVEAQGKSILLGADLENGPAGCGWEAVLGAFSSTDTASLIKVPHHGSPNAHHDGVWTRLVGGSPTALLAPFRGGTNPRPAPPDCLRILSLAPSSYITASPRLPSPSTALKRERAAMNSLARNVRDPWGALGHVRARSTQEEAAWRIDLDGPARHLADVVT